MVSLIIEALEKNGFQPDKYLNELRKLSNKRLNHNVFDSLLNHATTLNPPPAQPSPR